jgi:signal peptidase complex subunit 1
MDFEGQKLAEKYFHIVVTAFGVIGFIVGFFMKSFQVTVMIIGAGTLLAGLICVPAWPMFRQNPLPWLAISPPVEQTSQPTPSPAQKNKKKK